MKKSLIPPLASHCDTSMQGVRTYPRYRPGRGTCKSVLLNRIFTEVEDLGKSTIKLEAPEKMSSAYRVSLHNSLNCTL